VGAMQNVFLLDQAEKLNYITIPLDRVENTNDIITLNEKDENTVFSIAILSVPNPIMCYIVGAQLII
jgi:hypothetical protein